MIGSLTQSNVFYLFLTLDVVLNTYICSLLITQFPSLIFYYLLLAFKFILRSLSKSSAGSFPSIISVPQQLTNNRFIRPNFYQYGQAMLSYFYKATKVKLFNICLYFYAAIIQNTCNSLALLENFLTLCRSGIDKIPILQKYPTTFVYKHSGTSQPVQI